MSDNDALWEALRAPFPPEEIEKLPKPLSREDRDKGKCLEGSRYSADGHYCGGWHARSIHLDYVGHGGICMRLNEVVGPENWSLEPFALSPEGLPLMARGEFWVKLTILGVTKMEVAANYSSTQEAVGDALRRAAMRFGVGTYLWSKSDRAAALAHYQPPDPMTEARAAVQAAWEAGGVPFVFEHVAADYEQWKAQPIADAEPADLLAYADHLRGGDKPAERSTTADDPTFQTPEGDQS